MRTTYQYGSTRCEADGFRASTKAQHRSPQIFLDFDNESFNHLEGVDIKLKKAEAKHSTV